MARIYSILKDIFITIEILPHGIPQIAFILYTLLPVISRTCQYCIAIHTQLLLCYYYMRLAVILIQAKAITVNVFPK